MKYFQIFNLSPKFIFNKEELDALESAYLSLHKNLQSNSNKNREESILNVAYQTLKDEAKRLEYLVENKGFDIHSFRINEALAERIFSLREELEDEESEEEILKKINNVKKELENIKFVIERELKDENIEQNKICDLFSEFKCLSEIIKLYK